MKAATPLTKLSKYKINKIAQIVVDFCQINLGKCRNKQYPVVHISHKKMEVFMGEYDPFDHEVWVYVNNCKTVSEFIKTIIHEWTHSKQRVLTDYKRMHRKYGYNNNPLEVEAFASERVWGRKALYYVKKYF